MYSVMDFWRNTLLSNVSVNAFPGNGFVLNNGRIVGSDVLFAGCSEATLRE
jgi:hypothetical protein